MDADRQARSAAYLYWRDFSPLAWHAAQLGIVVDVDEWDVRNFVRVLMQRLASRV